MNTMFIQNKYYSIHSLLVDSSFYIKLNNYDRLENVKHTVTHLNIMLNSRRESSETPLWLLHKIQP